MNPDLEVEGSSVEEESKEFLLEGLLALTSLVLLGVFLIEPLFHHLLHLWLSCPLIFSLVALWEDFQLGWIWSIHFGMGTTFVILPPSQPTRKGM